MDPDGSSRIFFWVLLFLLIACNAFFVVCETAVISLSDAKVRKMAQEGGRRAVLLARLIGEPTRFLSTIRVGVTVTGFLASAVAADVFAGMLAAALPGPVRDAVSPMVLRALSLTVVALLLAYLILVFGERIPRRIAMERGEKISFAVAPALVLFSKIAGPFVALLFASERGILRVFGIDPDSGTGEVTEEEIRMMVDAGNENGNIEQHDKEMIHNIFDFDDRTAGEMMSHRTEILALPVEAALRDAVGLSVESGYSRIPVYREDLDNIVGILYIKDLLGYALEEPEDFSLESHMREPLYVLESTSCKKLLALFQESKIQMAVVVDEYGGTAGLVTMEDLLESIVGNIQDEYDNEEEEIIDLGGGLYQVDGLAPLEDVARFFGFAIDDDDDFDTVGGYLIGRIGRIPGDEDHPVVTVGAVRFTVLEMDERHIARVEVRTDAAKREPEKHDNGDNRMKTVQRGKAG